jgi:hypothetical protein
MTMVSLVTIDLASNEVIRETHVKWHHAPSYPWLLKHLTWAFKNGYGIQMRNTKDKEPGG